MSGLELVETVRKHLWSKLKETKYFETFLRTEGDNLAERLNAAFEQHVSTSILIIGPAGAGKRKLVEHVVSKCTTENWNPKDGSRSSHIATVNGLQRSSDHQALLHIVDQFLVRDPTDKNASLVLEDLESLLRVSTMAVIDSSVTLNIICSNVDVTINQRSLLLKTCTNL